MHPGPGQVGHGGVVGIEGLGDDDLVSFVQNGGEGHLQRLAAAGSAQQVSPAQVHAQAMVIVDDRIQVFGQAV